MLPHIQTPEAQSTVVHVYTARALVKDAGDRNTAHLRYCEKGYLSRPARKQICIYTMFPLQTISVAE
jgi:hypothetical protein